MPKPVTQHEIEIVTAVDREAGILDLRVYAHHSKRRPAQLVGTATLRMEDLREVLPLLTERLRFEDLCIEAETVARKSKRWTGKCLSESAAQHLAQHQRIPITKRRKTQ
jgi:hypothetical protein